VGAPPAERRIRPGVTLDAIVVGGGPNGLAAAIELARRGRSVRLYEAADEVGGGARSAALTLPGFVHDPCSSVHPLSLGSPFLRTLDLARHGLEWIQPAAPVAHALAPGRSVVLPRALGDPALDEVLGADARRWRAVFGPLTAGVDALMPAILAPPLRAPGWVLRHPLLAARFFPWSAMPAAAFARMRFREPAARALFAGFAAHSMLRLTQPVSAAYGLVTGLLAHAVGWPIARGGSGAVTRALEAEARALGVEIETGTRVTSLATLSPARAVILDLTPRQVLEIAGDRLPAGYRRALERFRYGPGVFKVDWALSGPIPWLDPRTSSAGTVHIGGTLRDVVRSEDAPSHGRIADDPFLILVQPTRFDPSRAPEGRHTAWAYCHVPNGSTADLTATIEAVIERHAPGFRDLVLARATKDTAAMEAWDANYVGGDINGGEGDLRQLLFRPVVRWNPYTTPDPSLFLASSSTPPGGGVHGMSGYHAARAADGWLRR
jgi:phytoene dehydrogenase-like protein